jgi:hypothetical protein
MSDDPALASVLAEAGEVDALVEWLDVHDGMRRTLTDPGATAFERSRARLVCDRLGQTFAERRELVDLDASEGR